MTIFFLFCYFSIFSILDADPWMNPGLPAGLPELLFLGEAGAVFFVWLGPRALPPTPTPTYAYHSQTDLILPHVTSCNIMWQNAASCNLMWPQPNSCDLSQPHVTLAILMGPQQPFCDLGCPLVILLIAYDLSWTHMTLANLVGHLVTSGNLLWP